MVEAEKGDDCSATNHYPKSFNTTNAAHPTRSERGKDFDQHSWLDRIHMDRGSQTSKTVRLTLLFVLWAAFGLDSVVTVALAHSREWGAVPFFMLAVITLVEAVTATHSHWKSYENV